MWLLLAQEMPDSKMLQGDTQQVMAWVILALVALFVATCVYFIKRQSKQEAKYDKLAAKTHKQIARSNRAMEAVADLPPPPEEDDEEEDD